MPTKKAKLAAIKQAMTSTERTNAMRDRLRAAGLAKLDLYVHPEDRTAIRAYATKLRVKRERLAAKQEAVS